VNIRALSRQIGEIDWKNMLLAASCFALALASSPGPRVHDSLDANRARRQLYQSDLKLAHGSANIERLLAEHQPQNVKEFSMGISAYGRSRDWKRAIGLLDEMKSAGVDPDVFSYSAAIAACEKAGRWEEALALLDAMRAAGVPPNEVSFNSAISACAKGGAWERALRLVDEMRAAGLNANTITFNSALSALAKAGLWERAMQLLMTMP
jgi:pentatricopeptide repeat protein